MRIRIRTKRLPAALMATRSVEAIERISQDVFQVHEAASTLGVMRALNAAPALVAADPDDLVDCPGMSRAALRTALDSLGEDGAVVVTSAQFTTEP